MSGTGPPDDIREQLILNDEINLNLFGRAICLPGWTGYSHVHDFWEVVYIHKEQKDPYLMQWEDGQHTGEQQNVYLIPPNTTHRFQNPGAIEAENTYVGFSFNYPVRGDLPIVVPLDIAAITRIAALLNTLPQVQMGDGMQQALDAKRPDLMRCITDVVKWMTDMGEGTDGADRNMVLIDKVKQYIMNNLDRYISVDELAKQLYLSPNYLGQIFRQSTGTTVKNYHNQMRMEHALNIIVTGSATVSEVADKLGFESIAYFSRRFKMYYGVSPSSLYKSKSDPRGRDKELAGKS